jgi:hypothetical protein
VPNTVPAAAIGLPVSGPRGRIPAGARADIIPVAEMPRRAFLSQLAKLPLIGGGLSIIGQPKAVAEPPTPEMLLAYRNWLAVEWTRLCGELYPGRRIMFGFDPNCPGATYHWGAGHTGMMTTPEPSTRAALVLSAIGCDWKDPRLNV